MNKIYAFLLLPVLLLSCGKSKEPVTMTLLTYNVGVFSKYEDDTTPQVADLIRKTGASLSGSALKSPHRKTGFLAPA